MTRTRNLLVAAAALTVVLSGCGSDTTPTKRSSAPANGTAFVLGEWSITPPTIRLNAGRVRITATNNGRETHELVIVRTSDAASLPTKPDGSVDEDKISEADKPGEIPHLTAGMSATKTLELAAGSYVALCNLVDQMGHGGNGGMNGNGGMSGNGGMGNSGMGHVHYRLGMVVPFTVT